MLALGVDQISIIRSCAKEEVASFLRPTGADLYINGFDSRPHERTCWDGQLQTKTSEFCLDTEMLLHLMTMAGISKEKATEDTEAATEVPKQSKLKETFKEWHALSSLRAKMKHSVLRGSRDSRNNRYVCISPALDWQYPSEQSAISHCSTQTSDGTVVHNEMFACYIAKPNSTTNVLRLIEVIE